jgi:hypothetical protein
LEKFNSFGGIFEKKRRFMNLPRPLATITPHSSHPRPPYLDQPQRGKGGDTPPEYITGAEQINIAVNRVNELSGENRNNIDILVQEVALFKTGASPGRRPERPASLFTRGA